MDFHEMFFGGGGGMEGGKSTYISILSRTVRLKHKNGMSILMSTSGSFPSKANPECKEKKQNNNKIQSPLTTTLVYWP